MNVTRNCKSTGFASECTIMHFYAKTHQVWICKQVQHTHTHRVLQHSFSRLRLLGHSIASFAVAQFALLAGMKVTYQLVKILLFMLSLPDVRRKCCDYGYAQDFLSLMAFSQLRCAAIMTTLMASCHQSPFRSVKPIFIFVLPFHCNSFSRRIHQSKKHRSSFFDASVHVFQSTTKKYC